MTFTDRKKQAVRELLEGPHPAVPPQLAEFAAARGRRILRRRFLLRTTFWLLVLAALIGLAVWAGVSDAWTEPPSETTPDFDDW